MYAFPFFSACANVCPISWDSLRLASPLLHSFLPFPLSTYKGQRRGKGVKEVEGCGWNGELEGWNGWRGWVKVMRRWIEDGARVEWRVECGVENVAKNWCQIKGYVMIRLYCIYSDHLRDPHDPLLGILPFPFHFSAAFSLLCPSPPFYISISAQYLLSCSEKDVRGRKCGEEWAGMENRESYMKLEWWAGSRWRVGEWGVMKGRWMEKNNGSPPWGGRGFSTIVYMGIESKITTFHWNLHGFMLLEQEISMFAARCQNAKKNFCNWEHLLEVQCNLFVFSVLSRRYYIRYHGYPHL